jgi:hypothetical protein
MWPPVRRMRLTPGGCGKNFLFFTPRKTNIAPLVVRMKVSMRVIALRLFTSGEGDAAAARADAPREEGHQGVMWLARRDSSAVCDKDVATDGSPEGESGPRA